MKEYIEFEGKREPLINIENMIEELTEYYGAAGFDDVYEKELKNKTDEEILELYNNINSDISLF